MGEMNLPNAAMNTHREAASKSQLAAAHPTALRRSSRSPRGSASGPRAAV